VDYKNYIKIGWKGKPRDIDSAPGGQCCQYASVEHLLPQPQHTGKMLEFQRYSRKVENDIGIPRSAWGLADRPMIAEVINRMLVSCGKDMVGFLIDRFVIVRIV
jgi:hypothetical protein